MKQQRVIIFKSGEGFDNLEKQINWWLEPRSEDVEIKNIQYQDNMSYCSVLILYAYEDK